MRTIRLKETRPGRDDWLTPSDEYRALCDDTLEPGPFRTRGTLDGFLDTGNERPDADMNLIMLGGSFVESNYCHEDVRFASQLERGLPRRWRVLNGGYSGMSTLHLASLLLAKVPAHLAPGSAVLVFIGQSDLEVMGQEATYWSTKPRITPIQPAPESSAVPWTNAEALRRMIDAALSVANALGLRYGVIASPYRDAAFASDQVTRRQHGRDWAVYAQRSAIRKDIVAATEEVASRHGVPFLNGQRAMEPSDFYDIMHLNAAGQEKFSGVLRSWLDTWLFTDRSEADDLGAVYCEDCGSAFLPVPGYLNDGHQCDLYGLAPEYEIPSVF